ncbi:restriction endonuclease subunit S [Segatella bryantii]|uniref:restriction endonuclease subunit S n=1 Tax=Segatella bryantii TaxID=77095 RepID=UPI0028530AC2|nr:restriction endonuclease subunit S [Segatella bryantii]MDR4930916.1 restriction endonuclease subunit S [Segatella bryantii]
MSEWKKVKLGDILQVKKGDYITKKEAREGIYPVILGGKEPAYFIDKYNHTGKAIVISRSGASAGYVSFWNEPIFVTDGFLIEPKGGMTYEFLYYALKSKQAILHKAQKGAAIPHVTPLLIGNIDFLLPNKDVQHRIATILSRYDSLIENYQKQIKLLEEAAQRLYKEWFIDLHFPGHENTKIVDGVPEGWENKTLGELFSYVRGKSYSSNEISDEGCIMVNLKNIQAFGGYKRDAEKRFIGKYKPEQTLQKGDLVMGVTDMTQERRLVGHVALIPDFNEPATFSMDLIKIIPYSVPIIYLYCAMRYGGISKQISPLANGVNVLHLKPDAMMGTMMVVPRKDLIERFCPFVEEMTNKILKNQSQIRLLTEARDRLLPKLMSGEIEI